MPRPKTLGGDIPCLNSPKLARKRQKALSARAELRVEQNLSPAAEGDCVSVLLLARVPSGQGGASSLIIALLEELLLLRLFLWFWVYLFLLNCYCGWAGYLAFRCYL